MKTNTGKAAVAPRTHEGGPAKRVGVEAVLRRSVMSCLLWEREFYEDGQEIATRIAALVPQVDAQKVAAMALEARSLMNLRHVPLLLVREMAAHESHRYVVAHVLPEVIQRADELSEFVAICWKQGRRPLSAQVKKGLAAAFGKFSAYQLAKYDRRDAQVRLRDVLFLCHAKPKDAEQDALWKKLIAGELEPPDTWEVALSGGADKREAFTRLLGEKKLGALALLRNLRNMEQAKVDRTLIRGALAEADVRRVLPFRFIAAARYAPSLEADLEKAMFRSLKEAETLPGCTAVLVDVSGSMDWELSKRSDMKRMDAAAGLAMVLREICEDIGVATFSESMVGVPPRRGFALRDAIVNSQPHYGTHLGRAVAELGSRVRYDRIVVITDEQSHDRLCDPLVGSKAYVINVASARNGVGYGRWTHIDGFSEAVVRYVAELESAS